MLQLSLYNLNGSNNLVYDIYTTNSLLIIHNKSGQRKLTLYVPLLLSIKLYMARAKSHRNILEITASSLQISCTHH